MAAKYVFALQLSRKCWKTLEKRCPTTREANLKSNQSPRNDLPVQVAASQHDVTVVEV